VTSDSPDVTTMQSTKDVANKTLHICILQYNRLSESEMEIYQIGSAGEHTGCSSSKTKLHTVAENQSHYEINM
jgi:hypothetical protein